MRFFTDFADTILRVNRGPLRLVIDGAHLFAPQAGTRGADAMPDMLLHAANNLISLGRSRGLRIVLISQRPAKVHKDTGATAPRRKTYRSWWNSEVEHPQIARFEVVVIVSGGRRRLMEFSAGEEFMEYVLGALIALVMLYILVRVALAYFFPKDRR
jgi:hypothetical protein